MKAPRAVTQQNMVMGPMGLGTKNRCAGEDQQQFSSQSVFNGLTKLLCIYLNVEHDGVSYISSLVTTLHA
jgi:hypothetical protein